MNLIYHASVGIVLDVTMNGHGIVFVASIAPDIVLIRNEFNLRMKKISFNENHIYTAEIVLYRLVHSNLLTMVLFFVNYKIGIAHLVHTVLDWFTHTGKFSTMPFYPLNKYSIKFGKNIFK
jgi:hypothetical protein